MRECGREGDTAAACRTDKHRDWDRVASMHDEIYAASKNDAGSP